MARSRLRIPWRTLFGVGVSVALLWWVFRGEDLGAVLSQTARADLPLLGVAAAAMATTLLIRALRWKVLLAPIHSESRLQPRFGSVAIGFMANNLLPLRVGEFARAYALSRLEPVSASGAFASLVVERFLDALALLGLLLVAVSLPSFPSDVLLTEGPLGAGVRAAVVLLGGTLAGLLALLLFPRRILGIAERLTGLAPEWLARPVVSALEAFLDGLGVLRRPSLLVQAVLWSVFLWMWSAMAFWIGFQAFGIEVGYGPAMLVNSTTAFVAAVPSAPGFFGTFHAGTLVGLTGVYGVERASTLSFAVGFHLAGFIPVTLIGLWYLGRLGFSMDEVQHSEERVEAAVEAVHGRGPGGEEGGGGHAPRARTPEGERGPP